MEKWIFPGCLSCFFHPVEEEARCPQRGRVVCPSLAWLWPQSYILGPNSLKPVLGLGFLGSLVIIRRGSAGTEDLVA